MRVVHFELSAKDPARAGKFFREVFGWRFEQWGDADYWMITTGPESKRGINGALLVQRGLRSTVCNTIEVDSIDQAIRQVKESGGRILVPKRTLAGVGYLAYFQDTEGNTLGLLEVEEALR